jgi:hypothetical protein
MKNIIVICHIFFLTVIISFSTDLTQSLKFDGVDDLVIIPNSEYLNPDNITVEFSFKLNSLKSVKSGTNKSRQFIVFKKNILKHFNEGIAVYFEEESKSIYATISNAQGRQLHISTGRNSVNIDEWYKIKVEANETNFNIYLNDIFKSNKQNNSPLNFDNKPLFIGGRNNAKLESENYGGMFNGELKDLTISSYRINESGNSKSLETLLKLSNLTDGVNINDESGNNNNGYLVKGSELLYQNDDITIDIYPNPIRYQSVIEFNIPIDLYLNFSIYSDNGKHIADLFSGNFLKGKNRINFSAENLSSGRYLLSINSNNFKINRYFLVLK